MNSPFHPQVFHSLSFTLQPSLVNVPAEVAVFRIVSSEIIVNLLSIQMQDIRQISSASSLIL